MEYPWWNNYTQQSPEHTEKEAEFFKSITGNYPENYIPKGSGNTTGIPVQGKKPKVTVKQTGTSTEPVKQPIVTAEQTRQEQQWRGKPQGVRISAEELGKTIINKDTGQPYTDAEIYAAFGAPPPAKTATQTAAQTPEQQQYDQDQKVIRSGLDPGHIAQQQWMNSQAQLDKERRMFEEKITSGRKVPSAYTEKEVMGQGGKSPGSGTFTRIPGVGYVNQDNIAGLGVMDNPAAILAAQKDYIDKNKGSLVGQLRSALSTPDRAAVINPSQVETMLAEQFAKATGLGRENFMADTDNQKAQLAEYDARVRRPQEEATRAAIEREMMRSRESISEKETAGRLEAAKIAAEAERDRAMLGVKGNITAEQMKYISSLPPELQADAAREAASQLALVQDQLRSDRGVPPTGTISVGGKKPAVAVNPEQQKSLEQRTEELAKSKERTAKKAEVFRIMDSFKTRSDPKEGMVQGRFDEKSLEAFSDYLAQNPDILNDPKTMQDIAKKLKGAGGVSEEAIKQMMLKTLAKAAYQSSGGDIVGEKKFGDLTYKYQPSQSMFGSPGSISVTGPGEKTYGSIPFAGGFRGDQSYLAELGIAPTLYNTRDPKEQAKLKSRADTVSALMKAFAQ